jgi:hypothetical protein
MWRHGLIARSRLEGGSLTRNLRPPKRQQPTRKTRVGCCLMGSGFRSKPPSNLAGSQAPPRPPAWPFHHGDPKRISGRKRGRETLLNRGLVLPHPVCSSLPQDLYCSGEARRVSGTRDPRPRNTPEAPPLLYQNLGVRSFKADAGEAVALAGRADTGGRHITERQLEHFLSRSVVADRVERRRITDRKVACLVSRRVVGASSKFSDSPPISPPGRRSPAVRATV